MTTNRFEDMNSSEIYSVFFQAIKDKEGIIGHIKVDGEKKPVFILKNNIFNEKYVLDLKDLSICQVKMFLGHIVSVNKVLDINELNNQQEKDKLKEELAKLSKKFTDDMKGSFLEKMKKLNLHKNKKEFKVREFKSIKPKRPMIRKPMAK